MLRKWLECNLARHPVSNARYDTVLCLGYKVKTDFRAGYGCRSSLPNAYRDMKSRCENMKEAIRKADALVSDAERRQEARMLKIFMAPEFFFRGADGGYDYDVVLGRCDHKAGFGQTQVGAQRGLLDILREETDKPVYQDWLFVLGTVVVLSQHTKLVCKSCNAGLEVRVEDGVKKFVCRSDPQHDLEQRMQNASVENVAYVCKESQVYTVSRELIANEDFAAAADERRGYGVFTVDGITFGLEIGLDHDQVVGPSDLRAGRFPRAGQWDPAGTVQIQLIASARTDIAHLKTVHNGVLFKVDGRDPSVQIVGERVPGIEGFEAHSDSRTVQVFAGGLPNDIPDAPVPDGAANRRGWHEAQMPQCNSAPAGSVVRYGPLKIPRR